MLFAAGLVFAGGAVLRFGSLSWRRHGIRNRNAATATRRSGCSARALRPFQAAGAGTAASAPCRPFLRQGNPPEPFAPWHQFRTAALGDRRNAPSRRSTPRRAADGFEHFKQLDFLRDHEVVLTFDDGPWPENTPSVLKTLADECTYRPSFFEHRQACDLLSGNPEAGLCGRPHHRQPHLVARDLDQQKADRTAAQGRDRKGLCRAVGRLVAAFRRRPFFRFPGAATPAGDGHLSRRAQHRDSPAIPPSISKASKAQQVIDVTMRKLDKLARVLS